uniref:Sushi domain-containing protein n=1 Tax=Magallana gigas TaxID=29159 RepID=A0A8W8JMW1_MAGGI
MTTYKQIFRYNESIEFHCAANYHIQGEAVRYCTQNDSFQQNLPTCSVITCQRPCLSEALQSTTDPHQQTYSYNESIVFNCSPGYTLHGPSIKYCLQNGDFNKRLPHCTVNQAQDTERGLLYCTRRNLRQQRSTIYGTEVKPDEWTKNGRLNEVPGIPQSTQRTKGPSE